jgi:hypothetical protein
MKERSWLAVVVVALSPSFASPQEAGSRVSVPLPEYEALKKTQERGSVTVVDTLRLGGSFRGRDLEVTLSGRAAGTMPAVDVLAGATGIVVFGCDGEGIVSRGKAGAFQLTPQAGRFSVRCHLAARGSDRLEMSSTPAVLWVESNIADGEFILGAESEDGGRQFSVVRRVASAAEGQTLKPTAMARYRITLRPDETRFHYEIDVHNPNRSRQPFEVALLSGEQVQQVDAPVAYDVPAGRYRFEIPPGDTTIKLSGSLGGSAFKPPIDASVQYCLLESHPLLRPDVIRAPKRVSPQEVGIPAEYRGAQAFIVAAGETVVWSATRLEALRTTAFAVKQVTHTFFLPVDGPALGESEIAIDNQGGSDVSLPMSATPTFASLQGDPVLLTKDAGGNLWLPLAQGQQTLVVQHRQPYRRIPGFGFASLSLPRLGVPATRGHVRLRYPDEWFPIYESFLSESRIWSPDALTVLGWLVLFAWTERLLAALGMGVRRRLVLAGALALAGVALGWALIALIAADLTASAIVWQRRLREQGVGGVGTVIAGIMLIVIGFMLATPSLLRTRISSAPYPSESGSPPAKRPPARGDEAQYQGLPAKLEMPPGVRATSFSRELLDTETPRAARVAMVSGTFLAWLQALVVVAALLLLWRERTLLVAEMKARLAAARSEETEGGAVAQ